MRHDDPNRPVPIDLQRKRERAPGDKNGSPTGNAAKDGYSVVERRPRSRYSKEMMPPERARDIERMDDDHGPGGPWPSAY